jgi:long-chain acyl-CoA synthetase
VALADHNELLGALRRVVCLAEASTDDDGRLQWLDDWLPAEPLAALVTHESDTNDLATIAYTSGTTGRPKGVMLSHRNILSNVEAGLAAIPVYPEDRFLSFLPLSHMLERTVGYYVPMMAGAPVTFARSIHDLAEDLKTARPTVVISVPLVFERIYRQILERLDSIPGVARWLFDSAVALGYAEFEWRQGRRVWRPIFVLAPVVRATIGRGLVSELGGSLRIAISGGAALARRISIIFLGLGLDVVQGYGLTETSPIVSVNRRENNDPAGVGVPLDGVAVRIAGDGEAGGELEVHGPSVMLGYWKNEPATRNCMTEEGWFKTGDNVRIDGGHIYIVGRSKEVIVLSNGEKAPPDDMEKAISLDPWFTQAVVLGDNRSHLSAIVVLSQAAQKAGVSGADEASREIILRRIDACLHNFPGYAKIKGVLVADEPWTAENGLLTSSLKKRRALIFERYDEQINRLYD